LDNKFLDLTLSVPIRNRESDISSLEVSNIRKWAEENRMDLNLDKTWEMVLKGNSLKPLPDPLQFIERKEWLKLLGVLFQNNPCNWDMHFKYILKKASSQLHILRVCKFYGYAINDLHLLFNSLIMPTLCFSIEVWGCAYKNKYLEQVDSFLRHAYRFGYISHPITINDVANERDLKLWNKILSNPGNPLNKLLPPKRTRCLRERKHNYILPKVRTERLKPVFINRCLFELVLSLPMVLFTVRRIVYNHNKYYY
jgi:hypothetical protein